MQVFRFWIRDYHSLWFLFPKEFFYHKTYPICHTPQPPVHKLNQVWAIPLSLATTHRISIDFYSSGYWDVSVPQVCLVLCTITPKRRVPPFGHTRIIAYLAASRVFSQLVTSFIALTVPRHPSYALICWSYFWIISENKNEENSLLGKTKRLLTYRYFVVEFSIFLSFHFYGYWCVSKSEGTTYF